MTKQADLTTGAVPEWARSTRDTYVDGVLRNDLTTTEWLKVCLGVEDDTETQS